MRKRFDVRARVPQLGNNTSLTLGGRGVPRFEEAPGFQNGKTGAFAKPKRPGHPFLMGYFRVAALVGFWVVLASSVVALGAEPRSALDLVSEDAAFCLEIPQLESTWTHSEDSSIMNRLRDFPPFQRFLESHSFQQWQNAEDHVTRQTGKSISQQLRGLFAKSLVLAIYVPEAGEPRGILIGEATDSAAIDMALATWNNLEPHQVTSTKSHHDVQYQQRKKHATATDSAFIARSGSWFAISDREVLIQDVIDRLRIPKAAVVGTLGQSVLYHKNRNRLKNDAAAYVYVSARPWDRVLQESSKNERDPIQPAVLWKHISSVSASLRLVQGVVCETVVELDDAHRPVEWSTFVATAKKTPSWNHRIPDDALFAVSGHLEISPLVRFVVSQIESKDKTEFDKNRRILRSLLGGHDLFDQVLPMLARDFSGCLVLRKDQQTNRVVPDGRLQFTVNSQSDEKLLEPVARGLETGLNLAAAYFSVQSGNVVTVENQQNGPAALHWLSEATPFGIALGLKGENLAVAGSKLSLDQWLVSLNGEGSHARLVTQSDRHFPNASQLVWIDTLLARKMLEENRPNIVQAFSHGSTEEASRLGNRIEQALPALRLVDSLFIAGQIEMDHVRIIFGGGIEDK